MSVFSTMASMVWRCELWSQRRFVKLRLVGLLWASVCVSSAQDKLSAAYVTLFVISASDI